MNFEPFLLIIWFITATILIFTISNRSSNLMKNSASSSIMVSSAQIFLDRVILSVVIIYLYITIILSY